MKDALTLISGIVVRVGRATVFLTGLAVILCVLTLGATSAVQAASGKPFILGKTNVASAVSTLKKQGPGPALRIIVGDGQPPLSVNSDVRVPNLNADKVDGQDAEAFLGAGASAGGDLAGTYPSPRISGSAVGSGEIADGTVGAFDVDTNQVQRRIGGSCAAGRTVRSVNQDGTVVCETDGVSGYEVVQGSSAFDDRQFKVAGAFCPAGKVPISGGGRYSASATSFTINDSDDVAMHGDGLPVNNGWSVFGDWAGEGTPPNWRMTAFAVCVNE